MPVDCIRTDCVSLSFSERPVLRSVSLALQRGELLGLIGPSGSGKSSLLKVIAGLIPPTLGDVKKNESLSTGLMFQEGALFDSCSVLDNVCFPLTNGYVPTWLLPKAQRASIAARAVHLLRRVGLERALHKSPSELSGGMKRRVSLARALITAPDVLLLDDPTSGLDPVASSVIMELISQFQQEFDTTMVVVSHDLRRLLPRCDRISALWNGEIRFLGSVEEMARGCCPEVRRFVSCRFDFEENGFPLLGDAEG